MHQPFAATCIILNLFASVRALGNSAEAASHLNKASLLKQASTIRKGGRLPSPLNISQSDLFYPSSYARPNGKERGFSNWLIPNKVMVGQYPGQNPEMSGPSLPSVEQHICSLVQNANVRLFCSLQSEIPSQDNHNAWKAVNGKVQLPSDGGRDRFPNFFGHYAPLVLRAWNMNIAQVQRSERPNKTYIYLEPKFIHAPIEDLHTPDSLSLHSLLYTLLNTINQEPNQHAIYIHCWGGRGRAGVVGACLLCLLYPELGANEVLDWVQMGYDSRIGSDSMPEGLRCSPQTMGQKDFVRQFVEEVHTITCTQ